jgi:hypothetical protein
VPWNNCKAGEQEKGGPTTLWPGRAATGCRHLPHPTTNHRTISGDSIHVAGLRTESSVEFQESGGLDHCRAVPQSAFVPRGGASRAHPLARHAWCASANKTKALTNRLATPWPGGYNRRSERAHLATRAANSAARVLSSHGRSHWFESSAAHGMKRETRRNAGFFVSPRSRFPPIAPGFRPARVGMRVAFEGRFEVVGQHLQVMGFGNRFAVPHRRRFSSSGNTGG